jgi:hypothetical protein
MDEDTDIEFQNVPPPSPKLHDAEAPEEWSGLTQLFWILVWMAK